MAPHALDLSSLLLTGVLVFTFLAWGIGIWEMLSRWGRGNPPAPGHTRDRGVGGWARSWYHEAVSSGKTVFVRVCIQEVLLLARVYRVSRTRWAVHMAALYGALFILFLSLMSVIQAILVSTGLMSPAARLSLPYLQVLYELTAYLMLAAVLFMLGRRLVRKEVRRHQRVRDYFLPASLLAILATGLVAEWFAGFFFAKFPVQDFSLATRFSDIHLLVIFGLFGLVLPWSRYTHIITTPLTLLARRGGGFP